MSISCPSVTSDSLPCAASRTRRYGRTLTRTSTQHYNSVVIPLFDPDTGQLPPGIHHASWSEIVERYGQTPRRRTLLAGLEAGIAALRHAGCRILYIDGSFVGAKEDPGDFDVCWESAGVEGRLLDPILLTFGQRRAAQKEKYQGEFFIAQSAADPHGTRYLDFFQHTREGVPKGIVALSLGDGT